MSKRRKSSNLPLIEMLIMAKNVKKLTWTINSTNMKKKEFLLRLEITPEEKVKIEQDTIFTKCQSFMVGNQQEVTYSFMVFYSL